MATTLLGLPGLRVVEVDVEADGGLTVYVVTSDHDARCPECGSRPGWVKDRVESTARDVAFGDRRLAVVWTKRRWSCPAADCGRRTFTEHLPALGHRRRITTRLRQSLAAAIADQGRDVAEAAAAHGVSWHTAHTAFAEQVDPVLDQPPAPVRVLGIDEIRRGKARWRTDPDTGITTQLADRWHTGFTDLSGDQGILGHTEGRARADVVAWLRTQSPEWLAGIQLVATDLCAAFRVAVRAVLPHAALCADPFHVVQAANRMVTKVRQRLVREHYGRRVRKTDPEYGIKRLLLRNIEDLTDEQFDKLWNILADHDHLADLSLAWSAKEDLRHILDLRPNRSGTCPTEAEVADRWDALLAWCQANRHIPELANFRQTLTNWRQEIFNTVLTGASNAGSEGVNRIQKLDARAAFCYRNPTNQQRRARIATLRSKRRSQIVTRSRKRRVVEPQHVPG